MISEPFKRLAIVGVGMMGGSLGLSVRSRGLADEVVGVDLNEASLKRAREMQAIDWGVSNIADGVRGADCVVFAAPVAAIRNLLQQTGNLIEEDALVTDLGSVKSAIVETGASVFGDRFVGGHPMTGSERSGVEASMPGLFVNAPWVVTRSGAENNRYTARVAELAQAIGAHVIYLDAQTHDRIAATVSHLPHLISFAYARAVNADPRSELAKSIAGGSYRDITRVSKSAPELWQDIFVQNRDALRPAILAFEQQLAALKDEYGL